MSESARLPDFVVIGAMKSGTTSLYRWLEQHPAVTVPQVKEPHFFSLDDRWERGIGWYRGLFAGIGSDRVTGEFSASYTAPAWSAVAAERMAEVLPAARLVYLLRDPRQRLRSHFAHQLQRGRERRSLATALADPDSVYVRQSEYSVMLQPYLDRYPPEQVLVVTLEELTGDDTSSWDALLSHLALGVMPRPGTVHNRTEGQRPFRMPYYWLLDHGLVSLLLTAPRPVRRMGRRLLAQGPDPYADAIQEALTTPLPLPVQARLAADEERLRKVLGRDEPLWNMT
jgi:hypothetical protein